MANIKDVFTSAMSLLGGADAPIVTTPILRGAKHTTPPGEGYAEPYFAGLINPSTLQIESADATGAAVTYTIQFTSAAGTSVLYVINTTDPGGGPRVTAAIEGGYLVIRNIAIGGKSYLKVASASPGVVAGLAIYSGQVSRAGDIDIATPSAVMTTPEISNLLSHDESLSSRAINRALMNVAINALEKLYDLDKEIAVPELVSLTQDQLNCWRISSPEDANRRISLKGSDSGAMRSGPWFNTANSYTNRTFEQNIAEIYVSGLTYGVGNISMTDPLNENTLVWGTPPGGGAGYIMNGASAMVARSAKTPPIAITGIGGYDVVRVSDASANFLTANIVPGDIVRITDATNNSPFNHNGEFVVARVLDAKTLSLRPAGASVVPLFEGDDNPRLLNPVRNAGESYGTLRVCLGFNVPLGGRTGTDYVYIHTDNSSYDLGASLTFTLPIARRLRDVVESSLLQVQPNNSQLTAILTQEFGNNLTFLNGVTLNEPSPPTGGGARQPTIRADVADSVTSPTNILLVESAGQGASANYASRIFLRKTGGFIFTTNAKYDPSTDGWAKDLNGVVATRIDLLPTGVVNYLQAAASNDPIVGDSWPMSPWSAATLDFSDPTTAATTPRISTPIDVGAVWSLIWEIESNLGALKTRLYASSTVIALTINARYNPASGLWQCDFGEASSLLIQFAAATSGVLRVSRHYGISDWGDSEWISEFNSRELVTLSTLSNSPTPVQHGQVFLYLGRVGANPFRDQLRVVWWDGSSTLLAESPQYTI